MLFVPESINDSPICLISHRRLPNAIPHYPPLYPVRVLPLLKLLLVEEELAAGRVLVHRVAAVHAAQGVQAESGIREFERVDGGT